MANFRGTYIQPADINDLACMKQGKKQSLHSYWTCFPKRKNEIIDCNDAEAIAAFRHGADDEFLSHDFSHFKPKTMLELMEMMTRFCACEDAWLTKKKGRTEDPGPSEKKDGNGKSWKNRKNKHQNKSPKDDKEVNAGFSNQQSSGKKRQFQSKKGGGGGSALDKILDQPCAIHRTKKDGDLPVNHTNRNYWVFKQAGKVSVGNTDKPDPRNNEGQGQQEPGKGAGSQKQFPT